MEATFYGIDLHIKFSREQNEIPQFVSEYKRLERPVPLDEIVSKVVDSSGRDLGYSIAIRFVQHDYEGGVRLSPQTSNPFQAGGTTILEMNPEAEERLDIYSNLAVPLPNHPDAQLRIKYR